MKKKGEVFILMLLIVAVTFLYLVHRYGMWYLIVVFQRIMHLMGFR